jgi:Mn2+/Fe2+ NRAMP family transporter
VETTKDAASALQPLAGEYAFLLFTGGLVGAGLLAIPTLAGSAAYAFAETFDWVCGLDSHFKKAVSFYAVFILATIGGAPFDLFHLDPVKTLFWSAVVNGVLAPFLLVGVLMITGDEKIMQGQPSSMMNPPGGGVHRAAHVRRAGGHGVSGLDNGRLYEPSDV